MEDVMAQDTQTANQNAGNTGFGAKATPQDKHLPENSKENLDQKLDNAVDETFPGSDPVSVKITK
jgi:hypothetical protein